MSLSSFAELALTVTINADIQDARKKVREKKNGRAAYHPRYAALIARNPLRTHNSTREIYT